MRIKHVYLYYYIYYIYIIYIVKVIVNLFSTISLNCNRHRHRLTGDNHSVGVCQSVFLMQATKGAVLLHPADDFVHYLQ